MSKENAFLRQENQILRSKLKVAQDEIAELKHLLQKRDWRIQLLQNQLRGSANIQQSRSEVFFQARSPRMLQPGKLDRVPMHDMTSISDYTADGRLNSSLRESGSLSFDSAIFDEHKPLINMDFRLPEFNKSRLFTAATKKQAEVPLEVPLQPIAHNQMKVSDFAAVNKLRAELQERQHMKSNNKLFKCFIVTGMKNGEPTIEYSFPDPTEHAQAILTLLYPQNPLRHRERTKSMTDINKLLTSTTIKDTFVIPLKQHMDNRVIDEYQYVVGCQTEELQFINENYYSFSRFFCFLSDYKPIKFFLEILIEVAKNFQLSRQYYVSESHDNEKKLQSSLTQNNFNNYFQEVIRLDIEAKIGRLHKNHRFDYNQNLRVKWSQDKIIMEDIPAKQNESNMVYGLENIIKLQNYKLSYGIQKPYEQNMVTFLCTYFLCEKRLLLYSSSKDKVTLTMLLLLELIKPLQFVNPILIGCLRQSYMDYVEAPMSIVLGLWNDKRNVKLEVSTRKQSKRSSTIGFAELIEMEKLKIHGGVVVNLDTHRVFGELDNGLNYIASKLTSELSRRGEKIESRNNLLNSLLGKVYANELNVDWAVVLKTKIKETQMYCYYTQQP